MQKDVIVIQTLNNYYSTTKLCYRLLNHKYLTKNNTIKIKKDSKVKINTPNVRTQSSKTIVRPDKSKIILFLPIGKKRKGEGGLRTKGYFKFSYKFVDDTWWITDFKDRQIEQAIFPSHISQKFNNVSSLPLITIITVVYNGEKYLEETIQSVINQTYPNVEYIIIDGGSTDGTLDIIKKYEDKIDYWVSEPDKGIYDAMNKGIDLASGRWINFMNAGDKLYNSNTLENIFVANGKIENYELVYGDVIESFGEFSRLNKSRPLKHLWKGMVFSHQSLFTKSDIIKNEHFNLKYKMAADFNFILMAYLKNYRFFRLTFPVSIVSMKDSLSYQYMLKSIYEWYRVTKDNGISSNLVKLYYTNKIIMTYLKQKAKLILPKKITTFLQKYRYSYRKILG